MARRKRSQKLKVFVIILVLCVLGGGGYLIWANFFKTKDTNSGSNNGQSGMTAVINDSDGYGGVGDDNSAANTDEDGGKKVIQFDGEDPNKSEELTGVITFAGVNPDGDKLVVRVNIDQFLENGSCTGYLYDGDAIVYESEVDIEGSASTSTCHGFDIPLVGIGAGKKKIVIKLEANGKSGKIIGEVDI